MGVFLIVVALLVGNVVQHNEILTLRGRDVPPGPTQVNE